MRRTFAFSTIVLVLVSACQHVGLGSEFRNHPAALVGTWVDVGKSTPEDTALWVLGASGDDASQHIRAARVSDSVTSRFTASAPHHYGYWYLQGEISDTAGRAICFTNRPGRSAPQCIAFDLDTVQMARGARRRLRVRDYHGGHSTQDRVLLAREQ